jgi:hypothetical protein
MAIKQGRGMKDMWQKPDGTPSWLFWLAFWMSNFLAFICYEVAFVTTLRGLSRHPAPPLNPTAWVFLSGWAIVSACILTGPEQKGKKASAKTGDSSSIVRSRVEKKNGIGSLWLLVIPVILMECLLAATIPSLRSKWFLLMSLNIVGIFGALCSGKLRCKLADMKKTIRSYPSHTF